VGSIIEPQVPQKEGEEENVEVRWLEDGTSSQLHPSELRGGLLVFSSATDLEEARLLRSSEDVKRRQATNPKQRERLAAAREVLAQQRAAAREAAGGKRKRGPDRRNYVRQTHPAAPEDGHVPEETVGKPSK
ncbi:unnamed protein product, partial [Polarella glacialis]